jgi:RNA polymerase sigma-70 factor (ECF subfamily)
MGSASDDQIVNESAAADQGPRLLALYDRALPQVYGYLAARVGDAAVAEDLTGETFLAAVHATRAGKVPDLTIAWLVTVARNKLVDHWRRLAREERSLRLATDPDADVVDDAMDAHFDRLHARKVLAQLGAHHRAALTLRYLDGLSVAEVADHLGRTLHATEALLVRARHAFRARYVEGRYDEGRSDD